MANRQLPLKKRKIPSEVQKEREAVVAALSSIVPMLGTMLGEHVEVVLHDMSHPETSVLKIANGHVTGRKPGSPVVAAPENDQGLAATAADLIDPTASGHTAVYPYATAARDGRTLASGTVILRDSLGLPFAAFCINADTNDIEAAHALLSRMLPSRKNSSTEQPGKVEVPDIETLIDEIITQSVQNYRKPVTKMNKEEKTTAVALMQDRGLFIVKGGVDKAAAALGVTRFTIYNYLDNLKSRTTT